MENITVQFDTVSTDLWLYHTSQSHFQCIPIWWSLIGLCFSIYIDIRGKRPSGYGDCFPSCRPALIEILWSLLTIVTCYTLMLQIRIFIVHLLWLKASQLPHHGTYTKFSQWILIADPKPLMSVHRGQDSFILTCSLPGDASNDTKCNLYIGEKRQRNLSMGIWKKKASISKQWFCQFTVTEDDMFRYLHFVRHKHVSCDYSLRTEPSFLSPRSDWYNFTGKSVKTYFLNKSS